MYSQHDLTFNLNNEGVYDFEHSNIGFCQEKSLMSPDITTNQLSVVTSGIITTNQNSEELKMNSHQNRLKLSNQGNRVEITKDFSISEKKHGKNLPLPCKYVMLIFGFFFLTTRKNK